METNGNINMVGGNKMDITKLHPTHQKAYAVAKGVVDEETMKSLYSLWIALADTPEEEWDSLVS